MRARGTETGRPAGVRRSEYRALIEWAERHIGVVIADAHDRNVLWDERDVLMPIDVVVWWPEHA